MKNLLSIIFITCLLSSPLAGQAEAISTALTIKTIKNDLTDLVDESMDRAEFTIAKAAVELLGVLDAWEVANTELLNKAFSELEDSSKNLFSRASSLISQVNEGGVNLAQTAEDISITAAQIGESLPFADKRTYILNYSPKVINPLEKDKVLVKLIGVNLDKADISIKLPDNSIAKPMIVGPKEINFWLPLSVTPSSKNSSKIHEIAINHKTRDGKVLGIWPKYKRVNRSILINTPPAEFASFSLTGTKKFQKEERKIHRTNCGRFEGRNKEIDKMARPPTGYKWDLRKGIDARKDFKIVTTGGGEKGRCQAINWNGSSDNGIIARARVDQIRQVRFPEVRWKNGYIHCGIEGPIYRHIDSSAPIKSQSGKLQWDKDFSLDLEEEVGEFELKIKLPKGQEKIITNNLEHRLFSVEKEGTKLIIRPKIPTEITN